jgi:hypothetical protein
MKRWKEIRKKLGALELEKAKLSEELASEQAFCLHPRLPEREIGTEYCDECPDCGHVAYCYAI